MHLELAQQLTLQKSRKNKIFGLYSKSVLIKSSSNNLTDTEFFAISRSEAMIFEF